MKTYPIRELPQVRLSGRFDPEQDGFPMMWTGACATMRVMSSTLEVQITCDYDMYKPYISFEVDGLRAQFFAPLKGTHWYNVYLSMDPQKKHEVRIIKETQAFSADPKSCVTLHALRTDGAFEPLPAPRLKLEFIGDSITSGEGMRGPKDFLEWVPMMFSASSNYTRYAADALHADVQVVSQSGWGVVSSWDNVPANNLPDVYDFVCRPMAMDGRPNSGAEKPYDFSFHPDWVIVNLGANDLGAMNHEAWTNPVTGESFRQSDDDASRQRFDDSYVAFLHKLHVRNPQAHILCLFGVIGDETFEKRVQRVVERAAAEGIPVQMISLEDMSKLRGGIGSREHPGEASHRRMAQAVVRAIRKG